MSQLAGCNGTDQEDLRILGQKIAEKDEKTAHFLENMQSSLVELAEKVGTHEKNLHWV